MMAAHHRGWRTTNREKDKTMCDICVMNRVKDRMLSRRDFFRGTAAAAGRGGGRRGVGPPGDGPGAAERCMT
jgi:hypothetical protein